MHTTLLRLSLFCLPLLLVSLLLAGCSAHYTHPNKPESMWDVDYDMCEVEVDYAVVFHHYSTTGSRPMVTQYDFYSPRYREALRKCMESKGYDYEDDPKTLLFDKS